MMSEKSINLDIFFDKTREDVEKKINDTITDKQIKEVLEGGKRLRSLLAYLSFKACTNGNETPSQHQRVMEGTVSIELAHTASLVHDDIIDNDTKRRGKESFHSKEGVGKAILLGHKMLTQGFKIALSHGKEVAKLYVDSWNEVVNGEIDEVDFNKNGNNTQSNKQQIFDTYYKIIDMKTAALFSSACKAGALEADMAGDILRVFANYGREIGLAYQLADDLVDLENGEMLDSVIIPLYSRMEKKTLTNGFIKKMEIKRKFAKNENEIKKLFIDEITKHVEKAEALSKSETIPFSLYKNMLSEAPRYIVNRMLNETKITI